MDQSRFNRKINFVLGPRGALLQAGSIIKITYPRFGWVNKDYRISNLTFNKDCTVQVTAFEHSDDTYIVQAKEKDPFLVFSPPVPGDETVPPGAPTSVTATGQDNSILIAWKNNISFGNPTSDSANPDWKNEVWVNDNASFTATSSDFPNGAKKIHSNFGEQEFEHNFPAIAADTTRYYWVRHGKTITKKSTGARVTLFSNFSPLSSSSGTAATAVAARGGGGVVYLYKSSINEPTDDPNDDSTFPTLLVTLSGTNAGQITGVKSGQGSAAITNSQIIDTSGAATGWYTVPQNPTNDNHVVWIVSATANSTGASDEILRTDWTQPVKFSGAKGADGADGDPGGAGDDAGRVVTGYIYWIGSASETKANVQTAVNSLTSGGVTYNFNVALTANPGPFGGNSGNGITTNFSISPPEASNTRQTVFYAPFTATETVSSGNATNTGPVVFGAVSEGINFTGVVTFSGTTITAPNGQSLDITQIDGSKITTGRIQSTDLSLVGNKDGSAFTSDGAYFQLATSGNDKAGSIAAKHFRLEGDTGTVQIKGETTGTGGGSIILDSTTQKITINDGGTDRVIIGKLN